MSAIAINTNNWINLVIKAMPKSVPEAKYLFSMKKYTAAKEKNVETVSVSIMPLKKKNVGDNARNTEASKPVFSLNNFFPVR
ncbi:hypothetical protein J4480_05900 [Candidatus Woesearchaeota archaeon]|nr:hypothetical protein [Candidatus Woesearchaeota archaeon]